MRWQLKAASQPYQVGIVEVLVDNRLSTKCGLILNAYRVPTRHRKKKKS
jgi:hypothetical protein